MKPCDIIEYPVSVSVIATEQHIKPSVYSLHWAASPTTFSLVTNRHYAKSCRSLKGGQCEILPPFVTSQEILCVNDTSEAYSNNIVKVNVS